MRYRTFGPSGLRVSELILGTMTFGEDWGWGAPAEECRRLFTAYAEAGGNMLDTANAYTNGSSERIVGDLLAADREGFLLATKYTLSTDGRNPNAGGNHRRNLVRSVEASLKRLRTDYIDLLWVHIWDPSTPLEETMRALDDLVRAGKVLYIGISDAPGWVVSRANTLAAWRGWSPFVALQVPYSLAQRDIERDLLPMTDALGMSVTAWGPLASGLLSGKFTRGAALPEGTTRLNTAEISERELAVAREVDAVADELGVTSAQVALAWTMHHRDSVHPVLGARRLDQLTDNLAALDLTLPEEAVTRLEAATGFELGFPIDFINQARGFVYGETADRTELRWPQRNPRA
ncbi:aldo/keto reductase [Streptomyces sp. 4N509B]|uniref:aldo/keto reductase n=1 Tax=Streptomyces sp. 4N509B TaxID=3457413 RepID=UPI003FCF9D00